MPKPSGSARPGRSAEVEVDAFVEGATERQVLKDLQVRGVLRRRFALRSREGESATGQEALLARLRLVLQEWLVRPEGGREPLHILVVLDQDDAEPAAIVTRVQGALRVLGPSPAELVLLDGQSRVYGLASAPSGLRLALCIAGNPAICDVFPALSRRAMDDDVLLLALQAETAAGMLEARHESRRVLGVERLLAKVKTEIPSLLLQNGLPPFVYAKDHIRFYAALLGISTSPAQFAGTVVQHAPVAELQRVFAPLLAAFAAL